MYYQRWNGAAEQFGQVIKNDPSNLDAYYWLTEVLLQEKKLAECKTVEQRLDAYIASHPDVEKSSLDQIAEAEIDLQTGDSAKAIAIFDDLLSKTKEKDPVVLVAIANAWLHSKSPDYNNVLNLLDKAEKRDKNNPKIYSLRGDVYRRLNNGGEAVQQYEDALKKDGHFAEAAYKMGKIYLTQNNAEFFLRYFNEAIAMDTAYAPA